MQPEGGSDPSIKARYLYGADGVRVKKLVSNQQNEITTTTYIDTIFEQHSRKTINHEKVNNFLHIMDNQNRIALVRVDEPFDSSDASPKVKYHLNDHLGSSNIVLGGDSYEANNLLNGEEYFPFGETSFGSFSKKKYRYSGKELDEETGLYYYGARYFVPWLLRWSTIDPFGAIDSTNLFIFVKNNPIRNVDSWGLKTSTDPQHNMQTGESSADTICISNNKTGYSVNINPLTGIIKTIEGDWLTKYYAALTGLIDPEAASKSFEIMIDGNWVPFSEGVNPEYLEKGDLVRFTGTILPEAVPEGKVKPPATAPKLINYGVKKSGEDVYLNTGIDVQLGRVGAKAIRVEAEAGKGGTSVTGDLASARSKIPIGYADVDLTISTPKGSAGAYLGGLKENPDGTFESTYGLELTGSLLDLEVSSVSQGFGASGGLGGGCRIKIQTNLKIITRSE
nr:RHS repeat-associated core domain-containing protein [uncultured Desulfobacter sp.]